jgi:hypothetical protein
MNSLSLVQRVARRIPAYAQSEYLDEVNAAYKECWDYIIQLADSYFTDQKIVTVAVQSAEFDFLTNANGNLTSSLSLRAFQLARIRVLQPGDISWIPAHPRDWNDSDFLSLQQLSPAPVQVNPQYDYTIYGKYTVEFARPLPVGTQLEVTYSFIWMPLVILSGGTITSSGVNVTGTTTNFTQVVPPDFQAALPGNDQDTDIGLEVVLNPGNLATQIAYRVKTLTSDTALTTLTAIAPALGSATAYNLCSVPDIPDGHHNVISTIATRNFMSTPGNDKRVPFWAALAEKEQDAMRDSIMVRQRQEPARVKPFPLRLMRYTSLPGTR